MLLFIKRSILLETVSLVLVSFWVAGLCFGQTVIPKVSANHAKDNSFQNHSGKVKILNFPMDCSIGIVLIRERNRYKYSSEGWKILGEAKGKIIIPHDKEVRLNISKKGSQNLSPLANIDPDAIQVLMLYQTKSNDNSLTYVANLTGLEDLDLRGTLITSHGLKNLLPLRSLKRLSLPSSVDDAGIAYISNLPALESLNLYNTKITDKALADISKMGALTSLSLGYTAITDKGLAQLKNLDNLTWLQFWNNDITDTGLANLSELSNLETLILVDTHITNAGMAHLANLKRLKELRIDNTEVGDVGLAYLVALPSLETLYVQGDNITDSGLETISNIHSLKKLHLGSCNDTTKGFHHLSALKNLEELNIGGSGLDDDGIRHISKLPLLKSLWLQNSNVTDQGLAELKAMKFLERIVLYNNSKNTLISDKGMFYLAAIPNLRHLTLINFEITGVGLQKLSSLKKLQSLEIIANGLSKSDVKYLAGMKNLESLRLGGIQLTDGEMKYLAGLLSLRKLHLYDSLITDKGLHYLSRMHKLETLQISGPITDDGIKELATLKSLRYIRLDSHLLSEGAISDLQKQLPSLQHIYISKKQNLEKTLNVSQLSPEFTVKTLKESEFRLSDHRGKVVLLHFWATWCSPCIKSTPALKKLHEELSSTHPKFVMLSLSLDEEDSWPLRHVKKFGLKWPQARIGRNSKIRSLYGIKGIPAYFLIGTDGKIISTDRDFDKLKTIVHRTFLRGS